jgi:hypothetical protein
MRRIFWGFCINRFGRGPLHYVSNVSSRSDFDFEFAEIFVIGIIRREKILKNRSFSGYVANGHTFQSLNFR